MLKCPLRKVGGGGGCHPSLEKGEFETLQDDFLHFKTCLSQFFQARHWCKNQFKNNSFALDHNSQSWWCKMIPYWPLTTTLLSSIRWQWRVDEIVFWKRASFCGVRGITSPWEILHKSCYLYKKLENDYPHQFQSIQSISGNDITSSNIMTTAHITERSALNWT